MVWGPVTTVLQTTGNVPTYLEDAQTWWQPRISSWLVNGWKHTALWPTLVPAWMNATWPSYFVRPEMLYMSESHLNRFILFSYLKKQHAAYNIYILYRYFIDILLIIYSILYINIENMIWYNDRYVIFYLFPLYFVIFYHIIFYYIVLYFLNNIILYYILFYYILLYFIILYYIIFYLFFYYIILYLCYVLLYYIILYFIISYYIILYYIILYYIILYYIISYYIMLY